MQGQHNCGTTVLYTHLCVYMLWFVNFIAMKDGFVESRITMAVIQGAARAGKTSLKSLILSLPYKELSTPCIQDPDIAVGTLSINRFGKSGKCWTCEQSRHGRKKFSRIANGCLERGSKSIIAQLLSLPSCAVAVFC